jgi:hypothetical protein
MKGQTGCLRPRLPFPNGAMLPTAFWTMSEERIYRGALKSICDRLQSLAAFGHFLEG